jgi:glycosyltransferase involved in cell wall biosynthesis
MKLSIIVPVYNEEKHLKHVFDYLIKSPSDIEREFIFVDDCSKDKSHEILIELQKEFSFKLIKQEINQGKGAAIIRGIKECTGDIIMIQDADFEYDPWDVPKLIVPIVENKADVVFGSRFKKNAPQIHRTYHYFVNRLLTTLSNLFSGIYLTDMETCYKIFRADLIQSMNLESKRFGIEVEFTAYIAKTSARIFELPVHYYPRTTLQGKKINWKDGIAALFHLVKFNFFKSSKDAFIKLPEKYDPTRSKFEIFMDAKGIK